LWLLGRERGTEPPAAAVSGPWVNGVKAALGDGFADVDVDVDVDSASREMRSSDVGNHPATTKSSEPEV